MLLDYTAVYQCLDALSSLVFTFRIFFPLFFFPWRSRHTFCPWVATITYSTVSMEKTMDGTLDCKYIFLFSFTITLEFVVYRLKLESGNTIVCHLNSIHRKFKGHCISGKINIFKMFFSPKMKINAAITPKDCLAAIYCIFVLEFR